MAAFVLLWNECISIHALLAESDFKGGPRPHQGGHFYPRSPCGERLDVSGVQGYRTLISIHALLAESDEGPPAVCPMRQGFLSTLSLRRATSGPRLQIFPWAGDFYPRSPCGERPSCTGTATLPEVISIHALLAESDAADGEGSQY